MKTGLQTFLLGFCAPLAATFVVAATDDPTAEARAALSASAHAYRAVPGLTDTFTYVVHGPDADREPKKIEIRLGSGRDASVKDALLEVVARGKTLYVTKSDAPDRYVARHFSGDFGRDLIAVVGAQSSLFEPPQIAMRSGKSLELCIDSFRFNLLGPLKVVDFKRGEDARGHRFAEIRFAAENGTEDVRIDETTRFLSSLRASVHPSGAPPGMTVEIEGEFSPAVRPRGAGVVAFSPGGRRAVQRLAELASVNLPVGQKAPDFALETPDGGRVSAESLEGNVAVLDFWATWCVPCWKTLAETQRLSDWARSRGLRVSIYAVNTMERFPTQDKRRERVAQFLKSQKITFPTLLDRGDEVFRSFGSPGLPSLVILTPRGKIYRYHQGITPGFLENLKREIQSAAASGS
ncbi:MAG TPA: TlpA disulfide reductase family protein [Thermoanaerobaculia bacterium]|nr:TlpA disulfide reductase family protein [Thermoanaerobaculia bacterium]